MYSANIMFTSNLECFIPCLNFYGNGGSTSWYHHTISTFILTGWLNILLTAQLKAMKSLPPLPDLRWGLWCIWMTCLYVCCCMWRFCWAIIHITHRSCLRISRGSKPFMVFNCTLDGWTTGRVESMKMNHQVPLLYLHTCTYIMVYITQPLMTYKWKLPYFVPRL